MSTKTKAGSTPEADGGGGAARGATEPFATAWEAFVLALRRSQARNRDSGSRLSLSQWDLLRGLGDGEEIGVGALAAAAGIAPATATRVLDGLERDGIVRRSRPRQDRRTVTVALTAEGRRRLRRTREWIAGRERRLLERLAPDEREAAARLLGHLAEIIEDL
jgi:DNA-binding MarR family transcriptional regulator